MLSKHKKEGQATYSKLFVVARVGEASSPGRSYLQTELATRWNQRAPGGSDRCAAW